MNSLQATDATVASQDRAQPPTGSSAPSLDLGTLIQGQRRNLVALTMINRVTMDYMATLAHRERTQFRTTLQGLVARPQPDVIGPFYSAGASRLRGWSDLVSASCSILSIVNGRVGEVVDTYTAMMFGRQAAPALPTAVASAADEAVEMLEEAISTPMIPAVVPAKLDHRSRPSSKQAKGRSKRGATTRGGKRGRRH